jgi:hypothetical protein
MYQQPELDLTRELIDLLETDKDCSPIQRPFILRKKRKDINTNESIKCSCSLSSSFSEGALSCPYCKGTGILFDEKIIQGYGYTSNYMRERYNLSYPAPVGRSGSEPLILITRADLKVDQSDKIYGLELTTDSKIQIPLLITHKYTVYFTKRLKASTNASEFNLSVLWD